MSAPSWLLPGMVWPVSVTIQNVGPTTWTAGQGFKLASQGDSMTWGLIVLRFRTMFRRVRP
jgi:hypothetical protein